MVKIAKIPKKESSDGQNMVYRWSRLPREQQEKLKKRIKRSLREGLRKGHQKDQEKDQKKDTGKDQEMVKKMSRE